MLKFSARTAPLGAALTPYFGRVFERVGATGHLLNQHYLDEMFRMEGGVVVEGNAFMDSLVEPEEVAGQGVARGGGAEVEVER